VAARRARNRLDWIDYYEAHAERIEAHMGSLAKDYRQKAEKLRMGIVRHP
jgi:hypothetical protein